MSPFIFKTVISRYQSVNFLKKLIFFQLCLFIVSCTSPSAPNIFTNCASSALNLRDGIRITDSLNHFSYVIPDSSWRPKRILDDTQNGLIVGDSSLGYIRGFSVIELTYSGDWDWDAEEANLAKDNTILATGITDILNAKHQYYILLDSDSSLPSVFCYIPVFDTLQHKLYAVNLVVEYEEDYAERFCQMKQLLKGVELNL